MITIKKSYTYEFLSILLLGIFLVYVLFSLSKNYILNSTNKNFFAIREEDKTKPLIRPLLAYNTPEMRVTTPLKESLKKNISLFLSSKKANAISLYYRDLNSGRWFGINQDETFVPASLFKVPLMITYLKDAERYPMLLSKRINDNLTEDQNKNETIKPLKSIIQGNSYSVEELLNYMIEYSDNNATVLLFKNINQNTLQEVFSDLDIKIPTKETGVDFISVTNYSLFFRVLYNATYLNHEMSEKGLEMLSKIDFEEGLRKSIPVGTPVADKFGEYYLLENTEIREHQLHDCGIVYHPKHPYILCIMTKGNSLKDLEEIIQSISAVTYSIVDTTK